MSRLTASPFHKPSPFEAMGGPPVPSSPPSHTLNSSLSTATVARGIEPSTAPTTMEADAPSIARGIDGLPEQSDPSTSSPAARFRKVSTMAYLNSGLRDARERSSPQRSPIRSFVIVIPPPNFQHEHGTLGHTLATGPSHRHSQGILMPLYPTFYAQVAAIAREWNFPSTSGICLYLQYTDNGITTTPRVSDDTWQFLWSNVLDPSAIAAVKPPIVGKLEFDLDMRLARWYSSWLASANRDPYELPPSLLSEAHFRGDSRTTMPEDDLADDRSINTRLSARPRHIPKKLSLVDRFDATSSRSRTTSRQAVTPPEVTAVPNLQTLSPIKQSDEPRSAKHDLASKVMSWRASASHQSRLLAHNGQISLDPANMPNAVEIDSAQLTNAEDEELNLADFTWSISSAGPASYYGDLESETSYYVPSVHLDRRNQGSVCLSPSICTSFGPADYALSDIESIERLPSPDIAYRMFEDCPPSPSICTSFGPSDYTLSDVDSIDRLPSPDIAYRLLDDCPPSPSVCTSNPDFSWPPSPAFVSRPPSVDLGARAVFSRPVTPSTATSWGAPLSFPPSPITPFHVDTPDAGQRAFDPADVEPRRQIFSFPYYDPSNASPWSHVWPYIASKPTTEEMSSPNVMLSKPPVKALKRDTKPWDHVWPYTTPVEQTASAQPWNHVWPYVTPVEQPVSVSPWNYVWPYNALVEQPASTKPWNHVWPYTQSQPIAQPVSIRLGSGYPYFELYAAQYPHNLSRIYPSLPQAIDRTVQVTIGRGYPYLEIYPAQYPHNLGRLYPSFQKTASRFVEVKICRGYPYMEIYSPQYPHNLSRIYPSLPQAIDRTVQVTIGRGYPYLEIYPAQYPHNLGRLYPSFQKTASRFVEVKISRGYPYMEIYSPQYPHNLTSIYPSLLTKQAPTPGIQVVIGRGYPHFQIYASIGGVSVLPCSAVHPKDVMVKITRGYPDFVLYSPLQQNHSDGGSKATISGYNWPYWKPSDDLLVVRDPTEQSDRSVSLHLGSQYPNFILYPPVYPFNLASIYPKKVEVERASHGISVRLQVGYPHIELYAPVYPHNLEVIYPRIKTAGASAKQVARSGYPFFVLYQPVYPAFDLYPAVQPRMMHLKVKRARLTHAQLHENVAARGGLPRRQPLKSHLELHREVCSGSKSLAVPTSAGLTAPPISPSKRLSAVRAPRGPRLPPPDMALPPPPSSGTLGLTSLTSPSSSTLPPSLSAPPFGTPKRAVSLRSPPMEKLPPPPSLSRHASTAGTGAGGDARPGHRKRDSIVLQRVRAFNSLDSTSNVGPAPGPPPRHPPPTLPEDCP